MGYTLGIESTAHTFSFGLCDENGSPLPSKSVFVRPVKGGIHPREAADHHVINSVELLNELLNTYQIPTDGLIAIAFSQGPGLGPCLRIGAAVARSLAHRLNIPLVGVNHCVAH
ncbi:MAG: UGMP family protein, partial [Candidatus Poseidoniaceae archaeon]|nr:UGMP family protein [Candidatus Poseidoniaceae archaeon]